jgi:hypothetical protein
MGASDLHRTTVMLAAAAPTTDRRMHPGRSRTQAGPRWAKTDDRRNPSAPPQAKSRAQKSLTGTPPLPTSGALADKSSVMACYPSALPRRMD